MGLRARIIAIAAAAAAAAAFATPADAASVKAQAKAKVLKPLTISSRQDLDLGILILGPGSWSGATISLSRSGALTCAANVTCSGANQVAEYNVSGSNNQPITINAPDVTMVNQADTTKTLVLELDAPASVLLTNSGRPGVNFPIGGSLTVDSTTPTGEYVGTFQVTAEYQ